MLKKIVAATAVAGAMALSGGSASAAQLCLTLDVNINGTPVAANQCVPPA